MDQKVSNVNDFKVVDFTNREDFTFTPEMGCMFNGVPIFGITGAPGINAGESIKLPYHVGRQLAKNLAKVAMTRQAPRVDPAGIPTGVPLWDESKLNALSASYLTDLYMQEKPVVQTETERLMQMVTDLNKVVEGLVGKEEPKAVESLPVTDSPAPANAPIVYQDKQDVIAELDKRGIKHDKRASKENLEKLLS